MELIGNLSEQGVAGFILLILRFSGIIAFFPFFDSKMIPMSFKAVMIFFFAILFFPIIPPVNINMSALEFIIAGLSEIVFGFFAAFFLQVVFSSISYAGEILGFSMGMSVASMYDPISSSQNLIVTQLITLCAIVIGFSLDFHHIIIFLVAKSLYTTPLGEFIFSENMLSFFIKAFVSIFAIGFTIAFPVVGIILLSDVLFGMITRAHPQFNLLVIGLPMKLILALIVLIFAFPAMIFHFKEEIMQAFDIISQLIKNR